MCNGNCGQGRQCDCVTDFEFEWYEKTEFESFASKAATILLVLLIVISLAGLAMLHI
jgi:hypothetical protein